MLGPAHAAEHAAARRLAGRSRALRRAAGARRRLLAEGPPAEVGKWSAPFDIPVFAINAALLPTGKLLIWGYPKHELTPENNTAEAWLVNPDNPADRKQVNPPLWQDPAGPRKPANIWCSGLSFLADGRLLVTGGNLAYPKSVDGPVAGDALGWKGLNKIYTFNPWNETWTEQPDMSDGRWYPTQVLQPDGRTIIVDGYDASGANTHNMTIDVFTPSADPDGRGSVVSVGVRGRQGAPPGGSLYPHMFLMPSGRTMVAGPQPWDTWFMWLSGASYGWSDFPGPKEERYAGTAVLLPTTDTKGSRVVMQAGGYGKLKLDSGGYSADQPWATTTAVDEAYPNTVGWGYRSPMRVARAHHNTVILPDGSLVKVGGGQGKDAELGQYKYSADQLQAEVRSPGPNGTWKLGAAQQEGRTYHSTALLLPDGRVLSAGDDVNGRGGRLGDTAEIYEPPYLHKNKDGARPVISGAPKAMTWGGTYTVATSSPGVARAVLVAPSAVTHANDMNQRHVSLAMTPRRDGTGVDVVAPPNANVAPPGYYMLFLLDAGGVPSVARWVRVGASDVATPAAPAPAPAPPATVAPPSGDGPPPAPAAPREAGTPRARRLGTFEGGRLRPWRRARGRVRVVRRAHSGRYGLEVVGSPRAGSAVRSLTGIAAGRYELTFWVSGRGSVRVGSGRAVSGSAPRGRWRRVRGTVRVGTRSTLTVSVGRGRRAVFDDIALIKAPAVRADSASMRAPGTARG